MVRHVFDLAALAAQLVGSGRFRHLCDAKLRADATRGREGRRINSTFPLDSAKEAVRTMQLDGQYDMEYRDFVANMVYARDPPPPTLAEALAKLTEMLAVINR